jgi:threonyl-tRNA synthetase
MSREISVTLPDGSVRKYPAGTTIREVARSIGRRLGDDAIGGVLSQERDSKVVDVNRALNDDTYLRIVTVKSPAGLEVLRHSCSHLLASAVQRLFPGTQVTFGPAIETGFYYDFLRPAGPFTPEEFETIEAEMRKIADADLPFVREEISRDAARALFEKMGEKFKREHVDAIPDGEALTLYRHGDWVDLCEGPHIPSTKFLKNFKLTHVSGAYWHGDETQPMLSRIYGTAFWDDKALAEHLHNVEEAKKRDHRRVGKDLDLFSFDPIAPAMPFFHAKGARIYNTLVDFMRGYYRVLGFEEVITPMIVDTELFKRSGHYDNYLENMFFSKIDEREYGVKPMNCPGHTLVYAVHKRSYRDLPIRMADFGRLHRYERSGVTAGLTRVRSFAQDDAHIFCREDQAPVEVATQIAMIKDVYRHFGFEVRISLSTRPKLSLGREAKTEEERLKWDAVWKKAEGTLEGVLRGEKLEFQVNAGDGAFYGPKIDFEVKDAIGRWHQLGTIQLDFGLPKRFELAYTDETGGESQPVMVHRAVLGSLERFIGILIEHTGGDFPVWLAPVQARIITLSDDVVPFGREVQAALFDKGVRVELDKRSEKLGYKIRDAELQKIPFVLVIGEKERAARAVAVRQRKKGDLGQMPLDASLSLVLDAATVPKPGEALLARVANEN